MRGARTQSPELVRRCVTVLALLVVMSAMSGGATRAEDYPDRPVKIIVPFAPAEPPTPFHGL